MSPNWGHATTVFLNWQVVKLPSNFLVQTCAPVLLSEWSREATFCIRHSYCRALYLGQSKEYSALNKKSILSPPNHHSAFEHCRRGERAGGRLGVPWNATNQLRHNMSFAVMKNRSRQDWILQGSVMDKESTMRGRKDCRNQRGQGHHKKSHRSS